VRIQPVRPTGRRPKEPFVSGRWRSRASANGSDGRPPNFHPYSQAFAVDTQTGVPPRQRTLLHQKRRRISIDRSIADPHALSTAFVRIIQRRARRDEAAGLKSACEKHRRAANDERGRRLPSHPVTVAGLQRTGGICARAMSRASLRLHEVHLKNSLCHVDGENRSNLGLHGCPPVCQPTSRLSAA
jgi:hypothetical protein